METAIDDNLKNLGYDDFFDHQRKRLGYEIISIARVTAEYKGAYKIIDSQLHEYFARITGKHMFMAVTREDYPAVGDFVAFQALPDQNAVIQGILPRKTVLSKKFSNKFDRQIIATNIDTAFIVTAVDRDYNLNRFERFLVLVKEANIYPIFILNKIDLISKGELNKKIEELNIRFPGVSIIPTSTVKKQDALGIVNDIHRGKTYCFLGSSGVGKSSLINSLLKKDEAKIREINKSYERGRHTTTVREMYFMEKSGIIIDNPGTREVGISNSASGISYVFEEIKHLGLQCKYSDCTHSNEPGCAVIYAVKTKHLDQDKYDNYLSLKKESDFYKMTNTEKRKKDRKFGQFIKKAKEQILHS